MPKYVEKGHLVFIQEGVKKRPYVCIKVFTNNCGVPYNWLMMPITSKISVGSDNLFKITHPKLHKESYVKINNSQTMIWDKKKWETKKLKINEDIIDKLINYYIKSLK